MTRWSASFTVPAWAEPREAGQAALWIGNAVIPVPPMHHTAVAEAPEHEHRALSLVLVCEAREWTAALAQVL